MKIISDGLEKALPSRLVIFLLLASELICQSILTLSCQIVQHNQDAIRNLKNVNINQDAFINTVLPDIHSHYIALSHCIVD